MTSFPFISIITASLNSAATLANTLESIKNQSNQDIEHIVIDGLSQDSTREILKSYEGSYNLQWISELDHGIADALNKGLKIARGKYISIIQADDRLLQPDTLYDVQNHILMHCYDIHSFPVYKEFPNQLRRLKKPIRCLWWNRFKFIFLHQGCFVHRRVFEKIGGFRNEFRINMDYDFFYRALNSNSSVSFGDFPVAIMGGEGIGTRKDNMPLRLEEEWRVQQLNENRRFWRFAQSLFRTFYLPYKMSSIHKNFQNYYKF
jgi:glycosyltransferase involved in cell wall biosynthesis